MGANYNSKETVSERYDFFGSSLSLSDTNKAFTMDNRL